MDPGTAIAVSELSVKILSLISKYYSDVKHAKSDIERLASEVKSINTVFQNVQALVQRSSLATNFPTSASLMETTEQALIDIRGLERQLDPGTGAKMMSRVGKRALKWPLAKKEVSDWVAKLERHKNLLNLALTTDQSGQIHDIDNNVAQLRLGREAEEQDRLLGKLHVADDAIFDSYHRQHESQCTANTRVELLQRLEDWGATHERPIFWLSGMAGTGKSTIARTLAAKLNERKTLGGSFFFSRASGSSKSAANFVGTLAFELASKSPQFKDRICEAISGNGDVLRQGLRNQWEELVIGPLSRTKLVPRPTISLIIDALDECGSDDDIRLILQLLVEVKDLSAVDLGVFVTSRPEIPIRLGFEKMPEITHQNLDLRDIPRQIVEQDIALFLRQELGRISQEHKLRNWPNRDEIQALVQRADGLFIYAATVCGFVKDESWNPQERLSEILRGGSAEVGGTVQLDEMYSEVLRCALTKGRREGETIKMCDRFKQIVGSIVTLSDILSVSALAKLLNIPVKNVELALGNLHSVLDIPNDAEAPVRLLHPSFHDFISNEERCEDLRFFVEKPSIHSKLCISCFKIMSAALRQNMCNLKTPGSSPLEVQRDTMLRHLPRHVQYACQYWVEHLGCARFEEWRHLGLRDGGIIHQFFQKYYLYWLEAMSLLGKMSDAVLIVARLGGMLKSDEDPALYALVADANRFNLRNRAILEEAPLQVYAAALIFCPKESLIRSCYQENLPTWLVRVSGVEDEWGPALQILEGHTSSVHAVAFSPDGKYLASASYDRTVGLWDPMTGALHSTLAGHTAIVIAVAFSSNCQLATVSYDNTVRIWDPVSGVTRHILDLGILNFSSVGFIDGSQRSIQIKFAPNGNLTLGSKYGRLHTWDPKTNALTTVDFSRSVADPLAFSSEGNLLFTKGEGRDGETLLYEAVKDTTRHVFSAQTTCSAFSSDNQIALALSDGTTALCDMATESHRMLDTLKGITALAFSPDDEFLVASCSNGPSNPTLRSYDLSTNSESLIGTHTSDTEAVAFSPDGRQLAFACGAEVHLWDPSTKSAPKTSEDRTSFIESLIFSHDGKHLASISFDDYAIKIWNPVSGKLHHTLTGHSNSVIEVTFSCDSQQIASASRDGTVRLWNPVRGTLQQTLGLPDRELDPHTLVYAKSGKELACAYQDGAVVIWNPANGALIQTLEGHSEGARMIAFSPNDQVLTSCSIDETLIIWNRATGKPPHKLETSFRYGIRPVFSPDGQYLAFVFKEDDRVIVAICDSIKGDLWKTLQTPHHYIQAIAFAPDNQLLAVSDAWDHVEIWHLATERYLKTLDIEQHTKKLSFSADGTYLETDYGEIENGYLLEDVQPSSPSSGFRWSIRGDWLMQGSRKMLWLPPDFRHRCGAYCNGTFVLDRGSRELTFLEVDLKYRPPE